MLCIRLHRADIDLFCQTQRVIRAQTFLFFVYIFVQGIKDYLSCWSSKLCVAELTKAFDPTLINSMAMVNSGVPSDE